MFWVMVAMVPCALLIGILAGMREGSRHDRALSVVSIATTATPEYVSGVILTVIFATWLGLLNGSAATATREGINFYNFTLPVLTIAIYGIGYIARMTRASMAEVMTQQYIRTARLKGLSFRGVVLKHALRNALIAPFTVIMLQFPWLLTGVVIVEAMFRYQGFGWLLVEAAANNDIDLLLACCRVGGHRAGHAADLRHRLCLSQPAHPGELGDAVMEYVGLFGIVLGMILRASGRSGWRWPSLLAAVLRLPAEARPLRAADRQRRRHRRRRHLRFWLFTAILADSSRRSIRSCRSPS